MFAIHKHKGVKNISSFHDCGGCEAACVKRRVDMLYRSRKKEKQAKAKPFLIHAFQGHATALTDEVQFNKVLPSL